MHKLPLQFYSEHVHIVHFLYQLTLVVVPINAKHEDLVTRNCCNHT